MPCTEGPPIKILTDPDAIPVVIHMPVPVPLPFRVEANSMLEANVKRGVLKKLLGCKAFYNCKEGRQT